MQPSDALCASLCQDIYSPTALIGGWDHIDGGADDRVFWALRRFDGFDTITFRGSNNPGDWITDFRAFAIKTRIGHVHEGFFSGMEKMWAEARPLIKQPCVVDGHSLGAGHADIFCGLMVADGQPPAARVVFGEPKPGLIDFAALIKDIPSRSYRNGDATHHDLVTDVPFSLPPLQYVHPTPVIPVCAEPDGDMFSRLGAFAYHHIELYAAALAALPPKEIAA